MKRPTYIPHLATYLFAAPHCYRASVLDLGCGEGYGTQLISLFASRVEGWDISPRSIKIAKMHKYHSSADFEEMDLEITGYLAKEVSVILAFEVLEHIKNPEEICQLVRPGQTLIFSVPHSYPHRLHKQVYTSKEQVLKLVEGFKDVKVYFQTKTTFTSEPPTHFDRYVVIAKP